MKASFTGFAVFSLAVIVGSLAPTLTAQDKKEQKPLAGQNVQGTVTDISTEKSTITIRAGSATRLVGFDANTKFLYGHSKESKPGSVAALKQSYYISCVAAFNDKKEFKARECIYRESK
jgi:hypothetical protein